MKASCKTPCESRMREIRTSGLMRGKEVGGHCLCALIPWLPSLLYSNPAPPPALTETPLQCVPKHLLPQKMILLSMFLSPLPPPAPLVWNWTFSGVSMSAVHNMTT